MAWFGKNKVKNTAPEEVVEEPMLPPPPATNQAGQRSMQDHAEYLLGLVEPLRPFGMGLLESWGQVICEDVESLVDVPAHSTALVEGYAVRAADLHDESGQRVETMHLFQLSGRLPVGAVQRVGVGDRLPPGATAVLPEVYVAVEGEQVRVFEGVVDGEYVRSKGEHLAAGQSLLRRGDVLDDRAIGLLASGGIDKVFVRPRPRVVVIGSGEGLAEPGRAGGEGEASVANSYLIAAAAKAAGAAVFHTIVGTNDEATLAQAVTDQLIRADLVISATGGKREDYEAMAAALGTLGQIDSAQLAMTPGRTQTFGLIGEDRIPVLMLPGNPVSAYVTFQAFCWPIIRKLAGADPRRKLVRGITTMNIRSVPGHTHLLRATTATESGINRVTQVSRPHALAELRETDVLVVLDADTQSVATGQHVYFWELD